MKRNRLFGLRPGGRNGPFLDRCARHGRYPDVPADNWAAKYVNDMTQKGIFTGISEEGRFSSSPTSR